MNNINKNHAYSPIGKTLYAKIIEDNLSLDGTFEALLSFNQYKCEYTCRLYSNEKNDCNRQCSPIILGNIATLDCICFDENGIIMIKIVG